MDDIRRSGSRQAPRKWRLMGGMSGFAARVDVAAVARRRPNRVMRGRSAAPAQWLPRVDGHMLSCGPEPSAHRRGTTWGGRHVRGRDCRTWPHRGRADDPGDRTDGFVTGSAPALRFANVAAASALLGAHIRVAARPPTPMICWYRRRVAGEQARMNGWRNDMRLSPRERRILAAIEDELERKDPALAVTFAETRLPLSFRQRFPLSKAHVCLLFLALLTVVLLHSVALGLGPAGLGVLTGALILPWLISASRANTTVASRIRRRRGQNTRRAHDIDAG